ncbi:MAG: UDP-N-acetylmuramoyl-tripeptide--D-alanyl-D-alanine ligase [Vulcanimicrobiaceae bacterium]
MSLPFDVAVAAMGAKVFEAERAPLELRISTDTRRLNAGDTFLALRGERFDGHDYVARAVEAGAAAVVLSDERARVAGITTLLVPDTLVAYLALAAAARRRFSGSVIAITGSSGKTTTKELLRALLALRYGERVIASPANENNEIGVSRLLYERTDADTAVLVLEMGARHYGDVATLVAAARPTIGILTNIGEAHLEIMGTRERLAQTKLGLFSTGARPILNLFDAVSRRAAASMARSPAWFGSCDELSDELDAVEHATLIVGQRRLVTVRGSLREERAIEVTLPGAHNRANLAAAITAALECGVTLDAIVAAIPALELPAGRFQRLVVAAGPRIIYDAYNANVSAMCAALDAFAQEPGQRHIAVLSSMAELGPEAASLHERVGAHAALRNVDILLVGGDYADDLARGAERAGLSSERILHFTTNEEAAAWLRANGRCEDVALLKGSRRYRLEEIVLRLGDA